MYNKIFPDSKMVILAYAQNAKLSGDVFDEFLGETKSQCWLDASRKRDHRQLCKSHDPVSRFISKCVDLSYLSRDDQQGSKSSLLFPTRKPLSPKKLRISRLIFLRKKNQENFYVVEQTELHRSLS